MATSGLLKRTTTKSAASLSAGRSLNSRSQPPTAIPLGSRAVPMAISGSRSARWARLDASPPAVRSPNSGFQNQGANHLGSPWVPVGTSGSQRTKSTILAGSTRSDHRYWLGGIDMRMDFAQSQIRGEKEAEQSQFLCQGSPTSRGLLDPSVYGRGDPCGRPAPNCCVYGRGNPCGRPCPQLLRLW